jgi:DNA-directed RNA polymerase subunit M/transcription elongation factor TFIIS
MSISFHCECGKKLAAKESFVGRRLKCPGCGKVQTIPKARAVATQLAGAGAHKGVKTVFASPGFVHFACDCGRKLRARRADVGRDFDCPRCGTEMTIPAADGEAAGANGGSHKPPLKRSGAAFATRTASKTVADSLTPGPLVHFACTCGRRMKARRVHIGQAIDCPSCNQEMAIPEEGGKRAPLFVPKAAPKPLPAAPWMNDVEEEAPKPLAESEPAEFMEETPKPLAEPEPAEFMEETPKPVIKPLDEVPLTGRAPAAPDTARTSPLPLPITAQSVPAADPVTSFPAADPKTSYPAPAPLTAKAQLVSAGQADTLVVQHLTPWRDEEKRRQSGKAPAERKVRSVWVMPVVALLALGLLAVEWYLVQETRGNPRTSAPSIGPLALVPTKAISMTTFRVADIVGDKARSGEGVTALIQDSLKQHGIVWNLNDIERVTVVLMESDPARAPQLPPQVAAGGAKGKGGAPKAKGGPPAAQSGTDEITIVQTREPYDQKIVLWRMIGPGSNHYRTHVVKRGYWRPASWDLDKAVCFIDAYTFVVGGLAGVHQFVHEQNTEGADSPLTAAAEAGLTHDFVVGINFAKQVPFAKGAKPPPLKAFQTALVTVDDIRDGAKQMQWALHLAFANPAEAQRAGNQLHEEFLKSVDQSGAALDVTLQTAGRGTPEEGAFLNNVLGIVNRSSRFRPR